MTALQSFACALLMNGQTRPGRHEAAQARLKHRQLDGPFARVCVRVSEMRVRTSETRIRPQTEIRLRCCMLTESKGKLTQKRTFPNEGSYRGYISSPVATLFCNYKTNHCF